ncbi:unnamed protein product [Meloidogyne enterolobii]|uniref:Uncharacterized protein n=1 Tax=Meloidogyne enterolobii TaxID=390850 RepID=A0ACB0ZB68_MELEN
MSSLHFSFKVLNLVDTRPKADELKQQSDSFRKIKHCSKKFLFFTKYDLNCQKCAVKGTKLLMEESLMILKKMKKIRCL